mmetsp:Transcript_8491/g.14748  ORF Transcript_8491/g.14748 Transcript_8491/m.14748 type:complete len:102 (-) Transcript_8491:41-346(-)
MSGQWGTVLGVGGGKHRRRAPDHRLDRTSEGMECVRQKIGGRSDDAWAKVARIKALRPWRRTGGKGWWLFDRALRRRKTEERSAKEGWWGDSDGIEAIVYD